MSQWKNRASADLNRLARIKERQDKIKWGPSYQAAIQACRGEVPAKSGSGTLPSLPLQRSLHAMSWPEKVAIALAQYANPLDIHEQHVYYATPTLHPLAFHPMYANLSWPKTDGTFALAEELGVERFHPKVWKETNQNNRLDSTDPAANDHAGGEWRIGFYIGDLMLYMRGPAEGTRPYARPWEVKLTKEDHGRPGGDLIRRYSKSAVERSEARKLVCAAYAAQLGTTIAEFSLDDVPNSLAASLVTLCRAQAMDYRLPHTATQELIEAFKEGVGQDVPARIIARRLLKDASDVAQAKILLEHAVWQRWVRVDLLETLAWDMPLLPERFDLLVQYRSLFEA
jgi:hypothetical protein